MQHNLFLSSRERDSFLFKVRPYFNDRIENEHCGLDTNALQLMFSNINEIAK